MFYLCNFFGRNKITTKKYLTLLTIFNPDSFLSTFLLQSPYYYFRMTINSFVTSTPHKENLSFFNKTSNLDDTVVLKPSSAKSKKKSNSRLAEFSDEDVLNRTAVVNARSKRERRKSRLQNPTDESLNVRILRYYSKYFLTFSLFW